MIEWLLAPIDPSRLHGVGMHLSWHGRVMVLAWAVLVPLGVVAARYFKVLPSQDWPNELDNRVWWFAHRGAQYLALALMLTGLWLILQVRGTTGSLTSQDWIHRYLGWGTLALAANQFLSGWLRGSKGGPTDPRGVMRGDHYDMTRRRLIFEALHKTSGYVALVFAVTAILTGLWQANAPVYMWTGVLGWWGVLGGVIYVVSAHTKRVATYEAIWGPQSKPPSDP
ncbi:MAG: hypothetical protein ACJASV_000841 [Pseudorhodobacter sp.]|jgi:hypothetical protein